MARKIDVDGKKLDPLTQQVTVSGVDRAGKRFERPAEPVEMTSDMMREQGVVARQPRGMPTPRGK